MSVTAIRAKLLTKLEEMTTLKDAWDWEKSNVEGKFPYATVTLREGEGEPSSSSHNLRKRGYTVRIRQEQAKKQGKNPEEAEDILTKVIDEFETAMDMDTTLSGTCKYVKPIGWEASWETKEMINRILEIYVDAYDLVSSQ